MGDMKPSAPDPVYPERHPDTFVKVNCPVCNTCWFDRRVERCLYNGPVAGFKEAETMTPTCG